MKKDELYKAMLEDNIIRESNVLVTGGSGFVGRWVLTKLAEKGNQWGSLNSKHDLRERGIAEDNIKGDLLIHCAAYVGSVNFASQHPAEMFYNNTLISLNTMEAARKAGVKRYINVMSNCVYPDSQEPFKESDLMMGGIHCSAMGYGYAKIASYMQAMCFHKQYGMDIINIIMPNVYGPGEHIDFERSHALGAIIQKMVKAKKENSEYIELWGDGIPVREWLYVEDAAEALVRCLEIESTIEPINIGCGKGLRMNELTQIISDEIGWKGIIHWDASKPSGNPHKVMNVERMKKVLGWEPQVGLQEGIKKTVQWTWEVV